jgi:outer membrane receptor protein involved in Fe transport
VTRQRTCFLAVALLLLASFAGAQTLTGVIEGRVTDEQGGALPGVNVTLAGKTGTRSTVTDAQGSYRFPALDPGSYEVRAEMPSFQTQRQGALDISAGKQLTVDMRLQLSGKTETVDVIGEAPVVDVTSSASNNALSQEILYNMPIDRRSFNIQNFAPGINDDSAFGGGAGSANSLLLDGVDTRDPYGGTPWTFFNYNIIQEVQIQGLGAPAEYGAYTGAVVNTISKSGGNAPAGLFDLVFKNDSLAGDNVDAETASLNPSLASPAVTTKYLDVTAQLSGPIKKDKLFFFGAVQRFYKTENPQGPRTFSKELSHRGNLKLDWLASSNDTVKITLQADDYSINGRRNAIAGADQTVDTMTVSEDAPEVVWNVNWRHLFGSSTFLEAKYLGWWGYFYLDPENPAPLVFDGATGQYSGGAGYTSYSDRWRHQLNASVTHYADAFGKHDFKFGVEVERSAVRERWNYTNYVYAYDGVPYYRYQYSYDLEGRNHRHSVFAQDSWKPNDRLTVNAGLRFDNVQGHSPVLGQKVFETNSIAPRIGFAFDLTGDHQTVLKAHYGQYYEGALFTFYQAALPGVEDLVTLDANTGEEIDRVPNPTFAVKDGIKQPRVDELTLGIERALSNDFRLAVTGIWRDNKNFIAPVSPSARWSRREVPNELTGGTLPIYTWVNRDDTEGDVLVTNPDGFAYLDENGNVIGVADPSRTYKGLMFVLTKRFSHRWQAQASYVLSKAEGTVDSESNEAGGGGRFATLFRTPNKALTNSFGESEASRRHEIKMYVTYQIPNIDLSVNAYYRGISGRHYQGEQRFSSRDINFSPSSGRTPLLEPRGSREQDFESILDLRLEKVFKIGGGDKLSVYADVTNTFNSGLVTQAVKRFPSLAVAGSDVPFAGPQTVIAPRQLSLGARWSF